jgi:tetratricopeptide (TPR) repeat protein
LLNALTGNLSASLAVSMIIRAPLITICFLTGISWAACQPSAPSTSQDQPVTSRQLRRENGYQHFRAGQYQKAFECYAEALQIADAHGSEFSAAVAIDLNDLAVVSEEVGRYAEARKYYTRELDVLRPLGDSAGAAIGVTYIGLADLSLIEGALAAAEADYKKAIVRLTRHAGAEDPRTAKALGGLGRLYTESGRYDEASRLLRNARAIAEKSTPPNSGALVDILDSEASLLTRTGKFAEAEKRWLSALKIAEHAYGNNGLQYTALLFHLGQLYTDIHEYHSAKTILERGLSFQQQTSGADDIDRAIMISALGDVYLRQHKLAQAEPFFLKSAQALHANCEAVPLACAAVRSNMGDFYVAKGQWQAAEQEYQQALTMRENTLGEHPLVASSLLTLSKVFRKLKRKKEAEDYVARAKKIMSLPGYTAYNNDYTIDVRAFRAGNQ